MHIRRLQSIDLDDLLALYQHLHRTDLPLPPQPIVRSIWDELMSSSNYHRYFGGFLERELICSCTLTVVPNLTRGCKPYGLIENVVTHERHRNKGNGKALLAHALADAWAAGCYKVMLMTGRKDAATLSFYEAAGFDPNEKHAFTARPAA